MFSRCGNSPFSSGEHGGKNFVGSPRNSFVFPLEQPLGMVDRMQALAVSGIVSGPFAIYPSPYGGGPHTLIHLPSQSKIIALRMQSMCKAAAEEFAALDLNW